MAEGKMIESRLDNGIAVLEINRPPVNSYTTELLKELDAAVLDARFDDNVHAIVITGKVEKFFSAGADINMLSSKSLSFKNNFALHGHEVLMRLENTPKIVIAAINGHAVGGGLEIAMACDIRIAKKEGGKVGLAEINLGVMPGMGGTQRLPRLVGKARAMELMLLGEKLPAQQAEQWGLINRCVPDAELMPKALELARALADGPASLGLTRNLVWEALDTAWHDQLEAEAYAQGAAARTEDAREGIMAFAQKRKAEFKGR